MRKILNGFSVLIIFIFFTAIDLVKTPWLNEILTRYIDLKIIGIILLILLIVSGIFFLFGISLLNNDKKLEENKEWFKYYILFTNSIIIMLFISIIKSFFVGFNINIIIQIFMVWLLLLEYRKYIDNLSAEEYKQILLENKYLKLIDFITKKLTKLWSQ